MLKYRVGESLYKPKYNCVFHFGSMTGTPDLGVQDNCVFHSGCMTEPLNP